MLKIWLDYIYLNHIGMVAMYPDIMAQNKRDYTTRIYRLVMSSDNKYVVGISATGGAFPVNNEATKRYDFNSEDNYSEIISKGLLGLNAQCYLR